MARARGKEKPRAVSAAIPRLHENAYGVWHWKPEKRLRPHWKGSSLGKDRDHAEREAKRLNQEVAAWLAARERAEPLPPPRRGRAQGPLTVSQVIALYRTSDAWHALRARTRRVWWHYLNRIEEEFGDEVYCEIKRPRVRLWSDPLKRRAPGSARSYLTAARAMGYWAEEQGHAAEDTNPFTRLKLPGPKKRKRLFSLDDVRHLVRVADGRVAPAGDDKFWRLRPSVGTALILAFSCLQRITDVIELERGNLHAQSDGSTRLIFDQSKSKTVGQNFELESGVIINVRLPPLAAERLVAAPPIQGPKTEDRIIVNEYHRKPYSDVTIALAFKSVRERAIACDPVRWAHLAGTHIRDARRSGFVHLRRMGHTVEQIVNLSGHSLKAGYAIVEHYMPKTTEEADAVAAKMVGDM